MISDSKTEVAPLFPGPTSDTNNNNNAVTSGGASLGKLTPFIGANLEVPEFKFDGESLTMFDQPERLERFRRAIQTLFKWNTEKFKWFFEKVDARLAGHLFKCKCGVRFRVPGPGNVMAPDGQTRPAPHPETSGSQTAVPDAPPPKFDPPSPWDGSGEDEPDLPWPIVRVRRLRWKKKEVIRLRPDGISLLVTRKPVTDELLNTDEAISGGDSFIRIDREKIRSVRLKRVGFITTSLLSYWSQFLVESDLGTHEFRVPDRETPHVLRALREIAGDRFHERPSRRTSLGEVTLLVLGIASGVLLALGVTMIGIVGGLVGAIGLGFIGFIALVLRWDLSHSEYRLALPPRLRRRRATTQRPFRSPVLGWGLKVAGLVYIVGVLVFNPFSRAPYPLPFSGRVIEATLQLAKMLPGLVAMAVGYRLCLRTFELRQHPDPRLPVLFLRAFDDDGKRTFQPTGLLAWLHGIFSYRDLWWKYLPYAANFTVWIFHPIKIVKLFLNAETYSSEELLGAAFRWCGPFVAIGRPGEFLATSGADRIYVPDGEWQESVLGYLATSQAVILQPAKSDGVRWETEHVFAQVPRHRVLLSMLNFKDRPNLFEEFRDWLEKEHKIRLSIALPFQDTPSFVYFESDGTVRYQPVCYRSPLLWTFVGSAVDIGRTFHTFVQGLYGGPRDLPLQPKRHFRHGALSVPVVLGIWLACFLSFGKLVGSLRYNATVANAIVQDQIRTVITIDDLGTAQQTTYRGGTIPYEFSLNADWKPVAIPPGIPTAEHLLEFCGGLGKLIVQAEAGKPLPDFFSDTLPAELRENVETEVRKQVPATTVKLLGTRWVMANGVQWREVAMEQHYGPGLSAMWRVLFYSGSPGWIIVTIVLPNYEHYKTAADKLVATFRAPETELDRLIGETRNGDPVVYRGKMARYRLPLRPVWRPKDMSKRQAEMGVTGKKFKALGLFENYDFTFDLGDGRFGEMDVEVVEGELDFRSLGEFAQNMLRKMRQAFEAAMPDSRFRFDLENPTTLNIDGHQWGEFKTLVSVSKDNFTGHFSMIYRVTNHGGKVLLLTARIQKEHPDIRRFVRESLDAVRLDD